MKLKHTFPNTLYLHNSQIPHLKVCLSDENCSYAQINSSGTSVVIHRVWEALWSFTECRNRGEKVSWSFICLKCFQDWSKLLKLVPTCKKLTECIVGKMGVLDTVLLGRRYSARQASATKIKGKGQTKVHTRTGNLGFTGWRDRPGGSSSHLEGMVLCLLTGTGADLHGRFLWGEVWCLFYVLATTKFTFAKL